MKEKHSDISLRITDILIDGKSLEQIPEQQKARYHSFTADYTKTLIIRQHIPILLSALHRSTYNQPQLNKYAYRLQGFDTDWHYVNAANRNAYYSQLPAGEYVFELRATNENGDWGRNADNGNPYRTSFLGYLVGISYLRFTNCIFLGLIWWEIRRRLMLRNRSICKKEKQTKYTISNHNSFSNITSDDEKFLQDAIDCVKLTSDDPEFDVTQFVNEDGNKSYHTSQKR